MRSFLIAVKLCPYKIHRGMPVLVLTGGPSTQGATDSGSRWSAGKRHVAGIGRDLLGDAVDVAVLRHERASVDADDAVTGHEVAQQTERLIVRLRLAESRHQHLPVRDVEVRVARGQMLALERDRLGNGQEVDVEALRVVATRILEPTVVLHHRFPVDMPLRRHDHHDRHRADEARHVIDVAIGIVARESPGEPVDTFDPEVLPKRPLDVLAGVARVASVGEKHRLRGDEIAAAVDLERPAFHDQAGFHARKAEVSVHVPGDLVVKCRLELAAPGIEHPVEHDHARQMLGSRRPLHDEDGTVIARPHIIAVAQVHHHAIRPADATPEFTENTAQHIEVRHVDVDVPHLVELGRDPVERLLDLGVHTTPDLRPMRPGEDGALVRRPLGRHAVVQIERGGEQMRNIRRKNRHGQPLLPHAAKWKMGWVN